MLTTNNNSHHEIWREGNSLFPPMDDLSSSVILGQECLYQSERDYNSKKEKLNDILCKKIQIEIQIQEEQHNQTILKQKEDEERKLKEEGERLEREKLEEIRRAEEERWRRELTARKPADIETGIEHERIEKLEEEHIKEEMLKNREEKRKKEVEQKIIYLRKEKERLAQESEKLEEELREIQAQADLERKRNDQLSRKKEELDTIQNTRSLKEIQNPVPDSKNEEDDDLLKDFDIIDVPYDEKPENYLAQSLIKQFDNTGSPIFSVYTNKTSGQSNDVDSIKDTLAELGFNKENILVVDTTNDFELAGVIKEQCGGNLQTPVLFAKQRKIGTAAELKELKNNGQLQQTIKSIIENSDSPHSPSLGVLDRALEGVENLATYLNPIGWIRWGMGTPNRVNEDEKYIQFEVIHTNWYWRHLRRIFKFGENQFHRMHPKHSTAPRATHFYDDIAKISIQNKNTLVISYNDNASPDCLGCTEADLQKMVALIKQKVPSLLVEQQITQ